MGVHDVEGTVWESEGVYISDDEIEVFQATVSGRVASLGKNFVGAVEGGDMALGDKSGEVGSDCTRTATNVQYFHLLVEMFQEVSG